LDWIDSASSVDDLNHNCLEHLELRERQKGAGTAYARQCVLCGEAKGAEVPKRTVTGPVPPFDQDLFQRYERRRTELYRQRKDASYSTEEVPLRRIQQRLNECLDALAEEFGPEVLRNATQSYLRSQREAHINQRPTRWQSEEELSDWLETQLAADFHVLREVPGSGFVNREKQNLRIDFVIRGKQHLIDHGFTSQYMGIEVKFLDYAEGKEFSLKSSKGFFQALTYWYSGALWDVGAAQPVSLAGVLLFSNLSFPDERAHLFHSYDQFYRALWRAYNSITSQANVGELLMLDYGPKGAGWTIQYPGARYFTRSPLNGLILGDVNLINRALIGNSGKKRTSSRSE